MRYLTGLATVASLLVPTGTAGAQSVISIGNSPARSCYESALSHRKDQSAVDACNLAFESSLSLPDTIATHVNRGIIHTYRGDYSVALRDFDRAIQLNPNEPEAYLNKGLLLLRAQGEEADVVTLMNMAITKNTRKPAAAHFGRAVALEGLGDVQAAYKDYTRAAALAPKWQLPSEALLRFKKKKG